MQNKNKTATQMFAYLMMSQNMKHLVAYHILYIFSQFLKTNEQLNTLIDDDPVN